MLLSDVDRGQRGQAVTASSVLIIFPRPGWQPHQGWQTTHQILHQAKLSDFVNLKRLLRPETLTFSSSEKIFALVVTVGSWYQSLLPGGCAKLSSPLPVVSTWPGRHLEL